MKNTIYKLCLALVALLMIPTAHIYARKTLQQARVYINPGHGGFGSNDRPLATINYAVMDTLGFFETKSNLMKAKSLYDELERAGTGYIKMSRTVNGIANSDANATVNDKYREGDVVNGVTQIITLSVIAQDVETNNMDYFLSIHSNALTDGGLANYPLLLYRGTDAQVGNGLVDAKNMALDAWKYIAKNGITYYSNFTSPTSNNTRGDITFMGKSFTTMGYTGYYGVLRHGCDGFLSEGSFHTYQPERHRLLNEDYCRQEGVRYARAIRAWFGDNSETKGAIMGTVKARNETLEHPLYNYAPNSVDAYLPLNGVTVVLKNSSNVEVGRYTTDGEYNGVYVFPDLSPGTYTLVYDFQNTTYKAETAEIVVEANKTSFINMLLDEAEPVTIARIFASDLKAEKTTNGYNISYVLNENATSVELILTNATTEEDVKTISLTGLTKGENTAEIAFTDIPEGTTFNWSIKATAESIPKFVKISDDSEKYHFFGPKGVATDKSPESQYFGRVYITNSDAGSDAGRTTTKGVYVLGADGTDITSQGNTAHTGGISWDSSTAGDSPRKVAVAADGRVFVSDYSHNNSGIYYMNPETYDMASIFTGATRETTHGKLTIGGTYVGGRTGAISVSGTGADTRLYGVDRSAAEAATWWKGINTYNIGEAVEWTTAPSAAEKSTNYIGNDNNSLSAVEGGYWAAQYRGVGGENASLPFMYYYSNAVGNTVYNTFDSWDKSGSSQNGGMAVNERENLIALAFNNGVAVFSYTMNGNTPIVSEKFISTLDATGTTYDDFEFDYAGNMYAVSYAGKLVSVWAMPTSDNSCITPAQKSMILENTDTGVSEVEAINISVYPNPINDYCVIESDDGIEYVEVYSNTGVLLDKVNGNAAKSITIDTSRYPKGIYLIKVNRKETVKVIK